MRTTTPPQTATRSTKADETIVPTTITSGNTATTTRKQQE